MNYKQDSLEKEELQTIFSSKITAFKKVTKLKKELYVISVDLQKAFDSIERGRLIEALMELNIDANIIEVICDIYSHDTTIAYT